MANKIKTLIQQGKIVKDNSFRGLSNKFLEKARMNLITMNLLLDLNQNKNVAKLLNVPPNYDASEWVVICGYYSMYSAALALIAKLGYKSKTHSGTISLLDEFYVKKNLLHVDDLNLLSHASLKKQELEQLSEAKQKREIAQYSVTKQTTKSIAEKIKSDAYSFVSKVEEILSK